MSLSESFLLRVLLAIVTVSLIPRQNVSAHIQTMVPENVRKMAFILHEHCVEVTGVDEDLTLQMIRGQMPEDKNFGCYLHCMFDTVGLVSPEGHINFQDVLHLLPSQHQEVLTDVVERCSTIREFHLRIPLLLRLLMPGISFFQTAKTLAKRRI